MQVSVLGSLEQIAAHDWNRLAGERYPFLWHQFLVAMERHGALGQEFGWHPRYLIAREHGQLLGAVPLYLKDNSYGEFVFDWSWADAYARANLSYYPKLVAASPYTPATGPRLLIAPEAKTGPVATALVEAAVELARDTEVSSLHFLFTDAHDTRFLQAQGLLIRHGCQFHWENRGYRDFDDFLDRLTASKRKKIKRERRRVAEQEVELEILEGDAVSAEQWGIFHRFYCNTFDKRGGVPTLSQGFFAELARTMPHGVVLVLARHRGRAVAAAFNLRGSDALYGRHWGCDADFHSLHFEACYYQGLDYCIRHGLQRFEPGAQGEHKISRGFLPSPTRSAHWIAHSGFSFAIKDFLAREERAVQHYIASMAEHSPYRDA